MDKIKKDGKAGLLYAYNTQGVLVSADDAVPGVKHTCPVCGCDVHRTSTRTGTRIFARYPGHIHTNSKCQTLERNAIKRSFKNLDPEQFIMSLCHTTPRGGGKTKGPENPGPGPNGVDDDEEFKVISFSSLKQIAESATEYLKAHDKQGDYSVCDYILTYKYAAGFFSDPSFNLGSRIVYARYLWNDSKTQSIFFIMFFKGGFAVRFQLIFMDKKEFKKYRNKLCEFKESNTGKTICIKRHKNQDVLIASDNWAHITKNQCFKLCSSYDNCEKCYGMYQAVFTSPKQIYLIPVI